MIPEDFESWKYCIQFKCNIPLTASFAKERLAVYSDSELPETKRFIRLYGEEHHARIKDWFGKIVAASGDEQGKALYK